MTAAELGDHRSRWLVAWRIGWTVLAVLLVEGLVCGLSMLPVLLLWMQAVEWTAGHFASRLVALSALAIPSYIVFALCLMLWSGLATRATGAHTPPNTEILIRDMDWRLMRWARYMVAIHLVRMFAGVIFRGSPIWTAYLRLSGARLGRRVYVNTLATSDHNLLEFDDDVVVGADVHLSGHTVEGGVVKTGTVRLGRGVTIGLGSVIDIDVEAGTGCKVGALSLVPKHTKLEAGAVYAGVPVRRIG